MWMVLSLFFIFEAKASAKEPNEGVVTDTVRIGDLHDSAAAAGSESMTRYMMSLMRAQKDSMLSADTDRTTLFPRHLSFADSLRILSYVENHAAANPVSLPFYIRMRRDTLPKTDVSKCGPYRLEPKKRYFEDFSTGFAETCNLRSKAVKHVEVTAAGLISGTERDLLSTAEEIHPQIIRGRTHGVATKHNFGLVDANPASSMWTKRLRIQVQATQNYATKNWYKGSANSVALLSNVKGYINYDNDLRLSWNNELEWRTGLSTVSGDTLRKVAMTDDLLRLRSTFGYRAVKKLYYSVYAELQTQFFRTYRGTNSPDLKATFFNPLRLNIGLGLEYKPKKDFSLVVSPAALKYIYVGDTVKVDPTQYGIKQGKKQLAEFGSTVNLNWHYRPIYEVELDTRVFFFTNYHAVELEVEITANFIINEYLSAMVSLYPRIDNTVPPAGGSHSYWQFKELISIGFSHVF